ncbi:MAG: ribose-phosphate pyrophosphokinase [Candidatus Pacebacteria bacterium]|nr:ribose-phosphate pyrophosphokinase [Candidatus Paceibacterota bacterium]
MKIVAGSASSQLATNIALQLNVPLVNCDIDTFANGEKRIKVANEVKNEEILIVQSFYQPVDERIIETTLIADALERLGAKEVSLFIPWFGYSFQDKVFLPGEPLSAKVIAKIIESTCIKKVYLLDLHNISIPGFFSIPTYHISAMSEFVKHISEHFNLSEAIVVSPDFGGLKRARQFANELHLDLASVDKKRDLKTGQVTTNKLDGDVTGKTVFIFDDAILSGQTVVEVAKLLKDQGAKEIHFLATHGVFTGNALEILENSQVDSVTITNSIERPEQYSKITVIDISKILVDNLQG